MEDDVVDDVFDDVVDERLMKVRFPVQHGVQGRAGQGGGHQVALL